MPARPGLHRYLTLVICALILACTLTYPFNNDNALYAYMADLALHGRMPYVGSWDQNFPAIVGVHAVQIVFLGRSQLAFHIFDILLQLVGAGLLFSLGKRLYDWRAGALAAVLASLYYVQQGLWMAGERDTYVTILLLWSLVEALHERPRAFRIGILSGLTFLFRPTYGLYPVILLAYVIYREKRIHRGVSLIAGALLPTVLLLVFYAAIGGLRDLWDATILFNFRIYSGAGIAFSFWEPVRLYWLSLPAALLGGLYLLRARREFLYLWLGLFGASVLSLVLLYRHSVYHYHPAMTLVLLLSAIGWMRLAELVVARWPSGGVATRLALPLLVILFFSLQTFRGNTIQQVLRAIARGEIHSLEECYPYYEGSSTFGYPVQRAVGLYLAQHTHPNDPVQMFGPYSYPQYLSRTLTASRFQTLHAITMRGAGDTLQPFQKEWRREYLTDLERVQPTYFIVCDAPEAFRQYYGGRLGHEILTSDFTELGRWLQTRYRPETKIGAFTLYRSLLR